MISTKKKCSSSEELKYFIYYSLHTLSDASFAKPCFVVRLAISFFFTTIEAVEMSCLSKE
jgi:hypothetical protein